MPNICINGIAPESNYGMEKALLSGSEDVFESGKKRNHPPDEDKEKDALYKAVGQLKIENDWLKKKI
jgi:transposase